MLEEPIDADATTPADLTARYADALADAIETVGTAAAAERTGLDADRLTALEEGGSDATLAEAAAVLALVEDREADAIVAAVRDHLMLSMSTAVLDVDAIAGDLEGDLTAREIQAKIEGRLEMSLEEYARIHHYIASRQ
jgi:hypothetical protein